MKALWLVLLVLVGCKDPNLVSISKCGQTCYTGSKLTGICQAGHWDCTDETKCIGEVLPEASEVCDGLDNNCDGVVDNGVRARDCKSACGTGSQICSNGDWSQCTAPLPEPERCDNRDNDCDGKIDEPEDIPFTACYTGNQSELQYGSCRPGVLRCYQGLQTCVGEVKPQSESCNAKDDNCNGQVDEGVTKAKHIDFVVVVDNSGSMSSFLQSIKQGIGDFSTKYGAKDIGWALVSAPDNNWAMYLNTVHLVSNFTNAQTFWTYFEAQAGSSGSSDEPTIDALYDICVASNPLGLSWTPDSEKIIVLLTDEKPQSYRSPELTLNDVRSVCLGKVRLYTFTHTVSSIWTDTVPWQTLSKDLNGSWFEIDSNLVANDLESVVAKETCNAP